MIKFFRKIRQNTIKENKFSKYLLYAIGEIILVVIGILIALQINNANDARKQQKELHQYLAKIKTNIELDIQILDSIKTRRTQTKKDCLKAMENIVKNKYDLLTNMKALSAFQDYYFTPNKSGFDALKNSPYLGKINGTKLDKLLDNYYALSYKVIKEETSHNGIIENIEYKFVSENDLTLATLIMDNDFQKLQSDPLLFREFNNQAKAIFNHDTFKATITRAVVVDELLLDYGKLMAQGNLVIQKIEAFIND